MPLYESGESVIRGKENVVKLSANENMNGPCNEVLNQFAYYSKNIFEYPDSNHFALRRKIGEIHDVDPNRIICGELDLMRSSNYYVAVSVRKMMRLFIRSMVF